MQNQVMQDLAAKRAELEARLLQLQQEQEAAQKEFELMSKGGEKAQEALQVLEQLLNETPVEMKPALFKSLYKALEQEAKRNGISLLAEATTSSNGNGKAPSADTNGKATRKTVDDISEPSEFAVFKRNNRLAVDGVIDDLSVRFTKVYVGIDGLRATGATESNAKVWKEYFKDLGKTQIKVGNLFKNPAFPQLEGNYMIEVSGVSIVELARLIDIDFGLSPTNEENVERMSREAPNLVEGDKEPVSEPTELVKDEPEIQHEEIREAEPVEVVPDAPARTSPLCPIGTKFQTTGLSGFESNYGEVIEVHPNAAKSYECAVDGFPHHLMLTADQFTVIPEDDSEMLGSDDEDETEETDTYNDPPF